MVLGHRNARELTHKSANTDCHSQQPIGMRKPSKTNDNKRPHSLIVVLFITGRATRNGTVGATQAVFTKSLRDRWKCRISVPTDICPHCLLVAVCISALYQGKDTDWAIRKLQSRALGKDSRSSLVQTEVHLLDPNHFTVREDDESDCEVCCTRLNCELDKTTRSRHDKCSGRGLPLKSIPTEGSKCEFTEILHPVTLAPWRLARDLLRRPVTVTSHKPSVFQLEASKENKRGDVLPVLPLTRNLHQRLINLHPIVLHRPLIATSSRSRATLRRSLRSRSGSTLYLICYLFKVLVEELFVLFGLFGALGGLRGEPSEGSIEGGEHGRCGCGPIIMNHGG